MTILPFHHIEPKRMLPACILRWTSVCQLCSKGLTTCYKTPRAWVAAVPNQFNIFGLGRRGILIKRCKQCPVISPKNKHQIFKKSGSFWEPWSVIFKPFLISAKRKIKGPFHSALYMVEKFRYEAIIMEQSAPPLGDPSPMLTQIFGILFHKW